MIAVVAVGLILLVLPGAFRQSLSRIRPVLWSRLAATFLAVGAGLVTVGLLAMALPTLLTGIGAHHLAALCQRLIHDTLALGHPGGIAATAALVVVGARGGMGLFMVRRARRSASVESWVGDHHRGSDHELVILPTAKPVAMSSNARQRQIILSTGLITALRDEELEMVIRHELSHMSHHHHRYLELGSVVEKALGWLPLVRASVQTLRLGLERWADEEAAGPDPASRRALRSALLATTGFHARPGFVGFGSADMIALRATALKQGPGPQTLRWWYPIVALTTVATASTAGFSSLAVLSVSLASTGLCYL
jgi:Zn-dependent protease with chaperone function